MQEQYNLSGEIKQELKCRDKAYKSARKEFVPACDVMKNAVQDDEERRAAFIATATEMERKGCVEFNPSAREFIYSIACF